MKTTQKLSESKLNKKLLLKQIKASKNRSKLITTGSYTLKRNQDHKELNTNSISKVQIRTTAPLHTDEYNTNRNTGSFVLIDEVTNNTVAAGMIV